MTNEDDIQRELDADPSSWFLRLKLADYLEDLGDPRAEGYRQLGNIKKSPISTQLKVWFWIKAGWWTPDFPDHALPHKWVDSIVYSDPHDIISVFKSRKAADDAAAIAYLKYKMENFSPS